MSENALVIFVAAFTLALGFGRDQVRQFVRLLRSLTQSRSTCFTIILLKMLEEITASIASI